MRLLDLEHRDDIMQHKHHKNTESTECIYVGIDIASQWLDVWLDPIGLCRRFNNTKEGISSLKNWLKDYEISLVVMEATGRLERLCARSLTDSHYPVAVLNPSQISGFRQAVGKIAKTDQLDAKTIALFARTMKVETRPLVSEDIQDLRDLGVRGRQITQMLTAERNRLKRINEEIATESIKKTIIFLMNERKKIEEAMIILVKKDKSLLERYDILTSIPGVGLRTALILISDLPELGTLDGKKISALAGVAPMNVDSGLKQKKARLRGGRRGVLYGCNVCNKVQPCYQGLLREIGFKW